MIRGHVVSILLTACLFSVYARAQTVRYQHPIVAKAMNGVVIDTAKQSIPGVTVKVAGPGWEGTLKETTTDINGRFNFPNVAEGTYYMIIDFSGFETIEARVRIDRKSRRTLKFILHVAI
jgi:hypothetical protein